MRLWKEMTMVSALAIVADLLVFFPKFIPTGDVGQFATFVRELRISGGIPAINIIYFPGSNYIYPPFIFALDYFLSLLFFSGSVSTFYVFSLFYIGIAFSVATSILIYVAGYPYSRPIYALTALVVSALMGADIYALSWGGYPYITAQFFLLLILFLAQMIHTGKIKRNSAVAWSVLLGVLIALTHDLTWAIGEYILIVLSILFYLKKEKNTGLVLFSGFISSLVVGLVWWVPRLSFFLNAAFISNNQGNGIFPTAIEPAQIIFVMIPTIIVLAVLCITIGISFIDNKASFDRRNPFLIAAVSISVFALYLPLDETVAARILLYIIPLVSVLVLMNIGTLDTFHIRFRRNGKSFRNVAIIQVILLILVMFGPIQVILDNNSSNFYLTGQFQYDQSLINYGATHFDNYTVVAPYIGQYLSAEDGTHVIMYTGFIVGPKQIQERNAAIWIVINPGSSEMNISKYNIGYVIIPSSWENSTVNGYHISLYRYFQLVYSDPYYSIYRTGIVSS
ncbi:MAG: hypothetical protein M1454_01560 [Candidatus Thermoplasmatota archaeon]|nr:hypothetical protein [Candidatus Thermoplasmatota archaeon]MCL5730945.1 hypothetical protein [Candidatus Thermoplasmatota archaeon]